MTPRLVTLATYNFPHEAHLDRARLESEGIPAFVQDEHMNLVYGGAVAVRLQVPQEFIEQAQDILWEDDEWEPDLAAEDSASVPTVGPVTCPRCQSLGAVEVTVGKLPVLLTALLLGLPLLFQSKRLRCRACGTVFKPPEIY